MAMGRKGKTRVGNIVVATLLSIGGIVMIAPLIWMLSTSLKTKDEVFALPPSGSPKFRNGATTSGFGKTARSSPAS